METFWSNPLIKFKLFSISFILISPSLLFLLGGCASQAGITANAGDPCGAQRAEFAGSGQYFSEQIVAGAITGGLLGAGTGAALAWISGGNVGKSAAIGLGTGAFAGAASAYYSTLTQKYNDRATLALRINDDLAREGQEMDHVSASFARLRECRFAQARQIKNMASRRQIDVNTAKVELARERQWFDEELAFARQYSINMAKRNEEFQYAAESVTSPATSPNRSDGPRPSGPVPRETSAQVVAQATKALPAKQRAFDAAFSSAETRSKTTFALEEDPKVV